MSVIELFFRSADCVCHDH